MKNDLYCEPACQSAGSNFIVKPEHVMAVGDAWDKLAPSARLSIITLAAPQGCIAVSCKWIEIPAVDRLELVHRIYLFRDFINEVLP